MRKSLIAVLAVMALTLTGCSVGDSYDSLPQPCGTLSDNAAAAKIQSTGAFDTKPNITFPMPLHSKTLAAHTLIKGSGPKFFGDQMIKFDYTALNAANGKVYSSSKYDGTDPVFQSFTKDTQIEVCKALTGASEGSRVAILIPAAIAHKNQGDASAGIGANDDIILTIDLIKVYYPRAIGQINPLPGGLGNIIRTVSGQPSWQQATGSAPKSLVLFNSITSANEQTVAKGDTVTLQYIGFNWATGTTFDSSWTSGPVQMKLDSSNQLIKGFVSALLNGRDGKPTHVGDEITAVIPPSLGYGSEIKSGIPANSTLVFIIDILGTEKAK
ncbi:MAG: FKBP-type peptidyl-prolyl cis-trans isomerase [Micrococcales bacterium]